MEEQNNHNDQSSDGEAATTVEEQKTSHDENDQGLKRRGDVQKCPVCGSHVDTEAYHCPSCRNYFCFHCRARLVPADPQLQCVNQHCDYYGKLVCDVCDRAHERDEAPTVYAEPEDGYWPAWLLLALLTFGCLWYFSSLLVAELAAVGFFVVGGLLLHKAGVNVFGKNRIVEHHRKSAYHSCINCGEVVKEIQKVK